MLPNFQGLDLRQLGLMNNAMPPHSLMEENINYYQEACKLYIANVVLTTQMKELVAEKNELLQKITKLEKRVSENQSLSSQNYDDKKKRHRRVATEIDRHYRCPLEHCQKSYGSEGSLTQHLKLKHPDYFSKIGLNQIYNLKDLDDMNSLTSDGKNGEQYEINQGTNKDQENSALNAILMKSQSSQNNGKKGNLFGKDDETINKENVELKDLKEFKEFKEFKESKEFKEFKELKDLKE